MSILWDDMNKISITNKKDAEKYIGKKIWILRGIDIDKSGRGYYFPRFIIPEKIEKGEFVDKSEYRIRYKDIERIKVLEN